MKVTFDIPAEVAEQVQAQPDPNQIAEEALRSWQAYHNWQTGVTPEIEGIVKEAYRRAEESRGSSRDELFDRLEDAADQI